MCGAARAAPVDADVDWPQRALQAVNDARLSQGLWALTAAPELQAIAQDHSVSMAATRRLTHAGFQARFDRTSSDLCVENVAAGTQQPAVLVAAWERAPQHRRNLFERRIRRAGIAAVNGYVTLFACE
jgi:uncharacterized protein YkwD